MPPDDQWGGYYEKTPSADRDDSEHRQAVRADRSCPLASTADRKRYEAKLAGQPLSDPTRVKAFREEFHTQMNEPAPAQRDRDR